MKQSLCLIAALLCTLQSYVESENYVSRSLLEKAVADAKVNVDSLYEYSRRVSLGRVKRNAANPSDIMRLMKQPAGLTRSAVRAADYMDVAVKLVKRSLNTRHRRSINDTDLLSGDDLEVIARLTGCSPQPLVPSCSSKTDKYRTISGVCNNRLNTRWGAGNTAFTRWFPAEYEDNISLPKGWDPKLKINGYLLPLVREVSNRIIKAASIDCDPRHTHLLTFFGQFINHDIALTPESPVIRSFNDGVDCDQTCENTEPCFPIQIPQTDSRLTKESEKCMPFFRSASACGSGYTGLIFGASAVRENINSNTAFIDADQIYGANDNLARSLRDLTSDKGLMRVNMNYTDNGRELLPFTPMVANVCATRGRITGNSSTEEVPCFAAGDSRTNENVLLTVLHTLMMREHNRLARALSQLNPHWDGERLYQEARKIMGGYFQVTIFRDYLPQIVGPDVAKRNLTTYPGYDENIDPSIANVFATAAFRFGHLTVQPYASRLDENYEDHPDYPILEMYKTLFTPWRLIFEGGVDPIMRGLVSDQAKINTYNKMMSDDLREKFLKFTRKLAMDLASLNLQRGRDHGLPGYNSWRKFCGLSQPKNLEELKKVMNPKLAEHLLELYHTPDNIDVWMGGVAETFVTGGRVGPLFACIIARQFQNIRQGDRFWWQNPGVFTEAQRESLKGTSFARIICDNTGLTEVPEHLFKYKARGSGYPKCNQIQAFDLNPWKEQP